jgi:hypothetical protein
MLVRRVCLIVVLALAAWLFGGTVASAQSRITPLSPKANATVPRGKAVTFRMRVKASGQVHVNVCKSPRKDSRGRICDRESLGQARRGKGGIATFRQRVHDFPGFWLNSPGTYYWQAFRIACIGTSTKDCFQESKIIKFKVGA